MTNRLDKAFAAKRMRPRKPTKKVLNNRRTFKSFGQNSLKSYRRKRSDEEVKKYAEGKRIQRLAGATAGELACAQLLTELSIPFEREAIFLNGDRFILVDIFIRRANLAIEIDGSIHRRQGSYDAQRDRWLLETHGIKTIRFTNCEILRKLQEVRQRLADQMELTCNLPKKQSVITNGS